MKIKCKKCGKEREVWENQNGKCIFCQLDEIIDRIEKINQILKGEQNERTK